MQMCKIVLIGMAVICLATEIFSQRIALICDDEMDSLRLGRQTWASIIDDFTCPTSTSFTVFQISNDTEMLVILEKVRKFDGVVVAATKCQIYDSVESSMKNSPIIPLLSLHFSPCPAVAGSHTERLDLYRLNDTNRDTCGSFALSVWLEHRICSSFMDNDTIRLLLGNNVTLDVSRELQDCSGLNELQWRLHRQPVAFQDKFTSESAEWHRQVNGKHLKLTSLERPPFVVFERDFNGVITGHKGYCYEIIHAVQKFYNFTYEVVFPADKTFGKELSNGSWDGMIGDILEQNADIGLGPFSVTHSRYKVVDFSVGFHEEATTILIPPPAEESRLLACTKPFRSEVWIALILFVIVLPAILWTYLKLLQIPNQETSSPALANQFFFVLGVLIGQSGQRLVSTGFWYRFLGAVWCLSAVVFASAYVGILVSFLRFPKLTPIINKLEDLPESQLKWSVLRGTALESLFTEATTGVYKTIGDGLLTTRGKVVDTGLDGIYGVINGSYAYIEEKSYLESVVAEDYKREGTCRLSLTYEDFFKVNLAFPLPKASPLKPLMDKKIMQIVEAGLGNYWKKKYWPQSGGKCPDITQSNAGPKSLRLSDLQGAFLILAMGFVSSSFIFLAERYFNYFRPCPPNRPVSYIR
ncbi:glutamate receptor ionotropic, kainate glr-3-like isoform X2 [Daphnia pulicaria]|uniref:glutamate receptor ionotropic, kainate glr-3-like isoform X2 n=1 Tax=Daphnia pulicaria TaxID=35523 RepID=UPI001EEA95C1|nr:glutamate receptor ionotropic, kainate glr-3-like isoform X2 [Daphnia pulicaria]